MAFVSVPMEIDTLFVQYCVEDERACFFVSLDQLGFQIFVYFINYTKTIQRPYKKHTMTRESSVKNITYHVGYTIFKLKK